MSFFLSQGYHTDKAYLEELLQILLAAYRGDGWYHDNPLFDYYSMWAFQMYGSLWSEKFGKNIVLIMPGSLWSISVKFLKTILTCLQGTGR